MHATLIPATWWPAVPASIPVALIGAIREGAVPSYRRSSAEARSAGHAMGTGDCSTLPHVLLGRRERRESDRVIECLSRGEAEAMLARVVGDEPDWRDILHVEPIEPRIGAAN